MSYIFSRALVEAYSEANCSASAPSAPSNSNPTPQAYCSPARMTAYSRLSRYGMTYAPLTDDRGAALLTWYLEASRARTFQPREKAPALTAPAPGSGGKCTELSMRYDRNSHSWKTHLCLWASTCCGGNCIPGSARQNHEKQPPTDAFLICHANQPL